MLLVLACYVVLQMGLGLWVARRVRTEDDYLVAGRRLGPLLAIVSMFATWFGAESCTGAAGEVYRHGVGLHTVEPFAYGCTLILLGAAFAGGLWRAGITTLADLFQQRAGASTSALAATLMVPTSLLWSAAQVRAFGNVLEVNSGGLFGEEVGIATAAIVVVIYTSAGGLLADVVTDLVQGVLLIVGCLALLVTAVWALGGIAPAIERVAALPARGPEQPLDAWQTLETWAVPVLGSVVAQEAISRSLASRSAGLARTAGIAGGALYVVVGLIPVALGVLGPLFVPDLADKDELLPTLARNHMPPIVNMLFAGALVSAILSTVDSSLLAASSVLTRNVIVRGRDVPQRRRLWIARLSSMGCGIAAWQLAHVASVHDLVEQASGFGSAGLFVVLVWSLCRGPTVAPRALPANCALLAGVASWIVGAYWLECELPFLLSLLAAGLGLFAGMLLARLRPATARDPSLP